MSAQESSAEASSSSVAKEKVPFAESDYRETRMTYDNGKLPIYIAAVWGIGLISLAAYYVIYGWPDLALWGAP